MSWNSGWTLTRGIRRRWSWRWARWGCPSCSLGLMPRRALIERLHPSAHLVDIEVRNLAVMADLVADIHEHGGLVVASYHDFNSTPSAEMLSSLHDEALAAGADVFKCAATLHSSTDLAVLAQWLESRPALPVSLMGMGRLGQVSRLLLAQLGSCLNYGYLDEATVPGQWSAVGLRRVLAELAR
jgi:3-dehydroquinate dehydratase I